MHYVVVYDITADNLRNKVSSRLKDYGLERIQYSAFQGTLSTNGVNSLKTDMKKLLNDGEETDSVVVFPLYSSCFNGRESIGAPKDMEVEDYGVSVF